MKWRDSDDDAVIAEEESHEDDQFSLPEDDDSGDLRPNLFKKNLTPLIAIAAGVIVVVVLVMIFLSGGAENEGNLQNQELISRMGQLGTRIAKLEFGIKQNADGIKRNENLIQTKMKRLDQLERSLAKTVEDLAKVMESQKQKPVEVKSKKVPASISTGTSQTVQTEGYHTVQAGENLYRISLRYNIKLDNLRKLNNLASDAVIKPGQKLKIAP